MIVNTVYCIYAVGILAVIILMNKDVKNRQAIAMRERRIRRMILAQDMIYAARVKKLTK